MQLQRAELGKYTHLKQLQFTRTVCSPFYRRLKKVYLFEATRQHELEINYVLASDTSHYLIVHGAAQALSGHNGSSL